MNILHEKIYNKSHNPRFIKIILTITSNFNSVLSKNNILKYVSKNDKFLFLFVISFSVQYIFFVVSKSEFEDFAVDVRISQK